MRRNSARDSSILSSPPWAGTWTTTETFCNADHRNNSGLFHFSRERGQAGEPDTLTPHLALDDKVLKDIIIDLYYPDSPYEFSVLPADILGSVYDQFLGKVITQTAGHRAVVEDKPEVKKAGGVFYTPTYIVEYIKVLEGETAQSVQLELIYLKRQHIEDVPLPDVTGKSPAHDAIVALVEQMLELHRQREAVQTPHEQTALDRQIAATDARIDRLVYDLYGLTEVEIKLVEGQ